MLDNINNTIFNLIKNSKNENLLKLTYYNILIPKSIKPPYLILENNSLQNQDNFKNSIFKSRNKIKIYDENEDSYNINLIGQGIIEILIKSLAKEINDCFYIKNVMIKNHQLTLKVDFKYTWELEIDFEVTFNLK